MSSGHEVVANEVQVKLSMCTPRKANRGNGGVVPRILNLCTG